MTKPKLYNVTRLQAIRVDLRNSLAGYYVLIVPDPNKSPIFRDFYLVHDDTGDAVHMFGLEVKDDSMAAELAAFAAPQYTTQLEAATL